MKTRMAAMLIGMAVTCGMAVSCGKAQTGQQETPNDDAAYAETGYIEQEETPESELDMSAITDADPDMYIMLPDIKTLTISITEPEEVTDGEVEEILDSYKSSVAETFGSGELTDEAVASLGIVGDDGEKVETADALREHVRKTLQKRFEEEAVYSNRDAAILEVEENAQVLAQYTEPMKEAAEAYILSGAGMLEEEMDDETKSALGGYVNTYITEQLIVRKIVKDNNLEVTEKDVIDYLAETYGEDRAGKYEGMSDYEKYTYTTMLKKIKAADYILENAITESD